MNDDDTFIHDVCTAMGQKFPDDVTDQWPIDTTKENSGYMYEFRQATP